MPICIVVSALQFCTAILAKHGRHCKRALGWLGLLRRLMLRAVPERCNACGKCSHACPMQLPVTEMVQSGAMRTTGCFMCETCVDVCPRRAIEVGFGRAI
jgi:polyferredoxin